MIINKLRLPLFYCSNNINSKLFTNSYQDEGIEIKMISIPCSGRVSVQYLMKAIETGADGVVLYTCNEGSCQYIEGNKRAKNRVLSINSILKESGFDSDRILLLQASENRDMNQIINEIKKFCKNFKLRQNSENVIL